VEGSCERAVFASPETVAAATAYMAARLSLLADAHDFTSRRDQSYESQIAGLRRTVAADRYGLSSQVLATRDGCTADVCDAFGLVYDDKKLRANLKDRLFDITVARYAVNWPIRTRPLASGGAPSGTPGPNMTFPSAQSIPPVSNTEPASPSAAVPSGQATQEAVPPTNSAPASATKRPPPPAAPKAAQKSPAPPPMSLNPTAKQ
jgi:hypothetical protein